MRLGGRLLLSVVLLTMYLPVAVVQAVTETIAISALSPTETAGVVDASVTVTASADGVEDPAYAGTVTFTSTDPGATLPGPYVFNGLEGHHVFSVTFASAGPQTLTVTDSSSLTGSAGTTVAAGAAAHVVLSGSNADLAFSDPARTLTATVTDAFTNPVPSQAVIFSKSAGTGVVTGLGTVTANLSGVATTAVTGTVVGPVTVQATAGTGSATLAFNVVAVGALDHVALTPGSALVLPTQSQSYATNAYDFGGTLIGNVSGAATLGITPDGSCASTSCTASAIGPHTVTSTYLGKSATATLTVSVALPIVNHAPTFTKGPDVSLAEESSPIVHAVPAWATAFSPGPANESSQTLLGYHLTNDHPLLFSTQPAIDTSGNLTYTLAANRNGVANVSVTAQDNGGTLNGGVDTSAIQTFTITVTGVDHPPAAINDFPLIAQGSGPTKVDVLANDSDPDGDPLTIASATQGTHGHVAIAANHKSLTYDPNGSLLGTDSFTYQVSDGRGGLAIGTVLVSVVKDTFGPVATAPRASIVASPIGSVAPIELSWSGTDQGFGVKTYQLQEKRNNASWASVAIPAGARSAHRSVAINSHYQYRVRAIDLVGNVGPWAYLSFTPTLYRETSATYGGPWRSAALSGALNGSVKYATAHGASASFTCTCSALAWLGPKGPTRGTARVYAGGELIGIFSEKSTTTLAAQRIMSVTWAAEGIHSIGIWVAGHGRVDVDGFLILH